MNWKAISCSGLTFQWICDAFLNVVLTRFVLFVFPTGTLSYWTTWSSGHNKQLSAENGREVYNFLPPQLWQARLLQGQAGETLMGWQNQMRSTGRRRVMWKSVGYPLMWFPICPSVSVWVFPDWTTSSLLVRLPLEWEEDPGIEWPAQWFRLPSGSHPLRDGRCMNGQPATTWRTDLSF